MLRITAGKAAALRRPAAAVTCCGRRGGSARPEPAGAAPAARRRDGCEAKSVILFVLEGGPAHQDLWDMKPDAPLGVRGEFGPIATTVPGLSFCEHLPMLAGQAHHLTLVRSVHHTIGDHNAGAYYALTGRVPLVGGSLITAPAADNFPPFGSVLAKLRPTGRHLPDFIHMPDWMSNNGSFLPGQDEVSSAARSTRSSPVTPAARLPVPGLDLPRELSLDRVDRRRSLLDALDGLSATVGRRSARHPLPPPLVNLEPRGPPRLRPDSRADGRPRAVRTRHGQPADQGGPPVRRPSSPGPMPLAGPSPDRSRRADGHRVHGGPLRPGLGHPSPALPATQAVALAHVRPRVLGFAGRSERARPARRDPGRRDGRVRPYPQGRPDHLEPGPTKGARPLAALLHGPPRRRRNPEARSTAPAMPMPPTPPASRLLHRTSRPRSTTPLASTRTPRSATRSASRTSSARESRSRPSGG